MQPVPLDHVAERAGEMLAVEVGLDEEVLRPGAHRLQPVSLIDRIGEKEERDRGCQPPQLGEGGEAATGGKRHSEEDDVDSAPRHSSERRLRLRRYYAEAARAGAFQQLPDLPCAVLLTAHHQHDELGAPRFRLAPAGGLAPIGGPASLGLVAPLLVERDDLQAALAQAALALSAAGRQEPPLRPAVLLACDHDTFKMAAGQRLHNRVRARLARPSGRWLDSEPMATQRKNRRKKPDRRSGADRRTEQAPVEVELRKGERRRTALTRRLELETAADQIHAELGLLTYAQDQGLLLDVDRWLLGTAIARLRVAMDQLGERTGAGGRK